MYVGECGWKLPPCRTYALAQMHHLSMTGACNDYGSVLPAYNIAVAEMELSCSLAQHHVSLLLCLLCCSVATSLSAWGL